MPTTYNLKPNTYNLQRIKHFVEVGVPQCLPLYPNYNPRVRIANPQRAIVAPAMA